MFDIVSAIGIIVLSFMVFIMICCTKYKHHSCKEREGKVYSGFQFNKMHKGESFYKIVNDSECHNGFQYKDGLNIDTVGFYPFRTCKAGGLYFANKKYIAGYTHLGNNIRKVKIPDDARVYVDSRIYKADKIILEKKISLWDSELWNDEEFCNMAFSSFSEGPKFIKMVKNPSKRFYQIALEHHPFLIKYIEPKTEELWKMAIEKNYHTLALMKPQTRKMCRFAIRTNPHAIRHVKNRTPVLEKLAREVHAKNCRVKFNFAG